MLAVGGAAAAGAAELEAAAGTAEVEAAAELEAEAAAGAAELEAVAGAAEAAAVAAFALLPFFGFAAAEDGSISMARVFGLSAFGARLPCQPLPSFREPETRPSSSAVQCLCSETFRSHSR